MPAMTAFLRAALLVVDERALEVVAVLAGDRRIVGGDADAIGAVAGEADFAGLRAMVGRTSVLESVSTFGPARYTATSAMSCSVIEAACECMVPCERSPLLYALSAADEVLRALAVQLGHGVRGVHVLVVRDGVAAAAGVGQCLATLGVADEREPGQVPRAARANNKTMSEIRNAMTESVAPWLPKNQAAILRTWARNCHRAQSADFRMGARD